MSETLITDGFDETPDEPGEITLAGLPHVELVVSDFGKRVYRVGDVMLPSVTTLLRCIDKPALKSWAAKSVAEWAVANLDTLTLLAENDTQAAIDVAKGAPWRHRDTAAARGTAAHKLIAAGVLAESLDDDDTARPYVAAYEEWLIDSGVTIVGHEIPVASLSHGWAGTIDLLIERDSDLGIVDLKTSRTVADLDGRLYPEMVLQLAAYGACDLGGLDLVFGSVLHLTPTDATEHPAFTVGSFADGGKALVGVADLDDLVEVMDAVRTLAAHLGLAATS